MSEFATYQNDTNFVEHVKDYLSAAIVSETTFECCARGSPAISSTNTAADAGEPALTVPKEPLNLIVEPVKA